MTIIKIIEKLYGSQSDDQYYNNQQTEPQYDQNVQDGDGNFDAYQYSQDQNYQQGADPSYQKTDTDYLAAEPGYQQPEPSFQQQDSAYDQATDPSYQQPDPGYQDSSYQPDSNYQQPDYTQDPNYQQPDPNYQEQDPNAAINQSYDQDTANYQVQPENPNYQYPDSSYQQQYSEDNYYNVEPGQDYYHVHETQKNEANDGYQSTYVDPNAETIDYYAGQEATTVPNTDQMGQHRPTANQQDGDESSTTYSENANAPLQPLQPLQQQQPLPVNANASVPNYLQSDTEESIAISNPNQSQNDESDFDFSVKS